MIFEEWRVAHGTIDVPEELKGYFEDWPKLGLDLGDGHLMIVHGHYGKGDAITGAIVLHRASWAPHGWCMGAIGIDVPENPSTGGRWQLVSWEPFHVEPSLLCKARRSYPDGPECGDHGFIRDNHWVRA